MHNSIHCTGEGLCVRLITPSSYLDGSGKIQKILDADADDDGDSSTTSSPKRRNSGSRSVAQAAAADSTTAAAQRQNLRGR